jgi:hypothetical protein
MLQTQARTTVCYIQPVAVVLYLYRALGKLVASSPPFSVGSCRLKPWLCITEESSEGPVVAQRSQNSEMISSLAS